MRAVRLSLQVAATLNRNTMSQRYRARVNLPLDGRKVVHVAQTVKSGPARKAPYVVERLGYGQ